MKLHDMKALFQDEDAVSPVIGVVLMVAITVILAAVIGAFVLNLGSQQSATPQASFEFDYNSTDVKVVHDGGDTLTGSTLSVKDSNTSTGDLTKEVGGSSEVTAGTLVAEGKYSDGETFTVTYSEAGSEQSAVLAKSTAN